MGKVAIPCSWCGEEVFRYPSQIGKNNYCCKDCRSKHLSKKYNPNGYRKHPHLSELNRKLNPKRMTEDTRIKIRKALLGSGDGKSYEKSFGRHTHRVVAEQKLGRELLPGEVVHHIDGNKRNNTPENLMVFSSQKEHADWHAKYGEVIYGYTHGMRKVGDANHV